jgi:threonine dehydratase
MAKASKRAARPRSLPVSLADIEEAARLIADVIPPTPFEHSLTLSERFGCQVLLKLENLHVTASFKERGALIKLMSLSDKERRIGVVAASAGNHAQGVAYNAKRLGIPATIVMPKGTPFTKVRRTEAYGATVVLEGEALSDAFDHAQRLHERDGLTFVHPYDDPKIIAGQGTIALEMLETDSAIDVIVVPIGGGGLISGIATAAKAIKPSIEIIGVEAEFYPSMYCAVRGQPPRGGGQTIAEGIAVKRPGKLTKEIVKALVDDIMLVNEATIEHAVQTLIEVERTVAEGAGAAALAALMADTARFRGKRVAIIVSGGNIDARVLASILMRGLVREGRLVRLRIEISDAPGTLAKVARLIGDLGGNIVEIYHQRLFQDVPVTSAELDVVLETRDQAHVEAIATGLRKMGFETLILSSLATGAGE